MKTLLSTLLLALALAGCATVQKLDAAGDVHALLLSIRDGDQAAFDRHVDRPALKRELVARLGAAAIPDKRLGALADLLGPAVADLAGDVLIQPQVFRLVAERYGYSRQTPIPNALAIAQMLKALPDGRVCATRSRGGPCLLVFTKEAAVWRLTGFEGDASMLRLKR